MKVEKYFHNSEAQKKSKEGKRLRKRKREKKKKEECDRRVEQ